VTVPLNPLSGLAVIVDEPDDPVVSLTVLGVATIEKSGLDEDWESRQAVNGWSSHPEKLCQLSETCASSQYANP